MRDDRDAKVQEFRVKFLEVLEDESAMVSGLSLAVADARKAFQDHVRSKPGYEVAQIDTQDMEAVAGDLIDLVTFNRLIDVVGLGNDRDAIFRRRIEVLWAGGGGAAAVPGVDRLQSGLAQLSQLSELLGRRAGGGGRGGGGGG